MSIYMNRLFPKSNSSFLLRTGNAVQSEVSRVWNDKFVVDAGIGSPITVTRDELTRVPPVSPTTTKFGTTMGYVQKAPGEGKLLRKKMLEWVFMDSIAGDSATKTKAVMRFNDCLGSSVLDAPVDGESNLVLPRRYRQTRVWKELIKALLTNRALNKTVRGIVLEKIRGGYAVGVAGFICFMPTRSVSNLRERLATDKFSIESINPKRKNVVVH